MALMWVVEVVLLAGPASGIAAVRALPDNALPGSVITVTITLNIPPNATVAAAEDAPPYGWAVSNISNGGSFDSPTRKVKWGLFFAPSIPATLSYDVTATGSNRNCFEGQVSYDSGGSLIGGDACVVAIPAVSAWGAVALTLLLLTAGTILTRGRA